MKIKTLPTLFKLAEKYHADPQDVMLLGFVAMLMSVGEVTIMDILSAYPYSSQATTHKRLKRLVNRGLLQTYTKQDERKKIIKAGTNFFKLEEKLKEA